LCRTVDTVRALGSGTADPCAWPIAHPAPEHQVDILNIDLAGIFSFTVSPLELVLRGTLMYWFLFVVFRYVLRRDVGSLGISDFLFVVILGDAAQNGMIGSATSATDGMVLIGTLVFWSYTLDFMSFQFPVIRRLTSAPRLCLVRDGKLLRRNMRRELITDDELKAKIRQEGVEDIASVTRMYLEADGEMSLIRQAEPQPAP
jgi:uncharacterized membrane protein YcaP (DUF421 family)